MNQPLPLPEQISRELLLHMLYEAAELEHNLMCTYLYAAFSLKQGVAEGLSEPEAAAVQRWRREILDVAIDEMSHLVAVWNLTSALGGVPRFGRGNFPLDPGYLPARVVAKLAPFNDEVLQHFIFLERPANSTEPEGRGFEPERMFERGSAGAQLTPMGLNYATVGEFYSTLAAALTQFVTRVGEKTAFCGVAELQLTADQVDLVGARRVRCLKTALQSFDAIVEQGEGAPHDTSGSHFARFCAIRAEYQTLRAANASFRASHPAATNPVLRRPPRPEGRVWLENAEAVATVDLANAGYGLMLRLLGYGYSVPDSHPDKNFVIDAAIALMQAITPLAEHAARTPAGPSNPNCNAGMSFIAPRDTAGFFSERAARWFFVERFTELSNAATELTQRYSASENSRLEKSQKLFESLLTRAKRSLDPDRPATVAAPEPVAAVGSASAASAVPSETVDGVEVVQGQALALSFETRRCIHARFCVTGAPGVFLANVQGPWLHPDRMDVERLVAVAHECPSGAIRYKRKDDRPDEPAPLVNLLSVREAGPYAVRAPIRLEGIEIGYRATLCRCGASKNKPFCDGSHKEVPFTATGEPVTGATDMLPIRDGGLDIEPELNGPLKVRGNLEITSGTGRVVARLRTAKLCRCGGSGNKPFCDGTHSKIGFSSAR